MTAVQSSYREFLELSARSDLEAQLERLGESEAADLLLERYAAFCRQGFDWQQALLLAVELA